MAAQAYSGSDTSTDSSDSDSDRRDGVLARAKRSYGPQWTLEPDNSWVHKVPIEEPWRTYKMFLYSRTGYNLAIYPDGRVNGTKDEKDLHIHLELLSGGGTGLVKIHGLLTRMYVGMNESGKLYAELDPNSPNIVFIEEFHNSYTTYRSKRFENLGWYIGIKKNGKFKRGKRTSAGQKAVCFLPRRRS